MKVTVLYDSGPVVWNYGLNYGFHTFPNLLENLLERGMWLCLHTNALPLTFRGISEVKGKVHVFV